MDKDTNLVRCLNAILNNVKLNAHEYSCNSYRQDGDCNCDTYTDEEIAAAISTNFGYILKENDDRN